jgi:hypothetical protein
LKEETEGVTEGETEGATKKRQRESHRRGKRSHCGRDRGSHKEETEGAGETE